MRRLPIILVALLAFSSNVSAQLFQWSSLGIADEAVIPTDTVASMGCGTLALEIEWSAVTVGGGSFVAFAGADFVSYEATTFGGLAGGVLQTGFDNANNDFQDIITIEVHFNQSVEDLAFDILDVDSGSWDDGIEIFYNGANNARTGGFITATGSTNGVDNETYMHGYEGYGTNATSGSTAGNISLDFTGTSITSFSLRYFSTDDANTNPGGQVVGISNLTFGCDNPTSVLITEVRLEEEGGQRWLEWDTAWHASTAGFFAYRWDRASEQYVTLNETLLSTVEQQDGGVFAALDDFGNEEESWYLIEEVRTDGDSTYYGPFAVSVSGLEEGDRSSLRRVRPGGEAWSGSRAASPEQMERLAMAREERRLTALRASSGISNRSGARQRVRREPLQIDVMPGQMVGVPLDEIAAKWGMRPATVARLADRGRMRLSHRGEKVAWTLENDRLIFYAGAEEPKFSYTTEYWLRRGRGRSMEEVQAASVSNGGSSVVRVVHKAEEDLRSMMGTAGASEEDLYAWQVLVGGSPVARRSFAVDLDKRVPDTALDLSVEMLGLATLPGGAVPQHVLTAFVEDTALGQMSWSGTRSTIESLAVAPGALSASSISVIELESAAIPGATLQGVFVDALEVGYSRYAIADEGFLAFEALVSGPTTVLGVFPDAVLLDVTDPLQPVRLRGSALVSQGSEGLTFEGIAGHHYAVADAVSLSAPAEISQRSVFTGGRVDRGVEYVVIAPAQLLEGAEQLAAFRSEYSSLVVSSEELYDRYTHGAADPEAIRRFLRHMSRRWGGTPKFVVLVGAASFDRKNITGLESNVLPTFFRNTPHGMFSSDVLFGDLNGDDVPEVAVGRIPAVTNAEVLTYIAKLRSKSPPAGTFRGTLLADNFDSAGDFEADSEALSTLLDASSAVNMNFYVAGTGNAFLDQLQSDYSQGLTWGNYFGHGGFDRFALEALVELEDVQSLTGPFLPTITALSCQIGRFELPINLSLAEALVLADGAGALAVWAPSGLSQHGEADELARAFVKVHGEDSKPSTMGEAVQAALRTYADGSPVEYMQLMYNLLGDPAVSSPLAAAAVHSRNDGGGVDEPSDPKDSLSVDGGL